MTFPRWRTQLRLHLALRLLAEGLPVTTVGHRCGWSTTSAFVDVFRRALGHTPGRSPRMRDPGRLAVSHRASPIGRLSLPSEPDDYSAAALRAYSERS